MRTKLKVLGIIGAMLVGIAASGAALADRGWHGGHGGHVRSSFGVFVGVPLFSPWYYPPAYYYPPAVVAQPPVYVEQGGDYPSAPAPQAQQFWYYCNASQAYYPNVTECPGGWQRVAPQPG